MSAGRGNFFAIDRRVWPKVCDCGINEAVAYLVLARGTDATNRNTKWSTTSVSRYGGIGVERSKAAIDNLIRHGFLCCADGHTRTKPRHEFIRPDCGNDIDDSNNSIWLPNTIVTGTSSNELPPVARLRGAGDVWSIRLFVDFYEAQNLRDDGGISPHVVRENYARTQVGEQGIYTVWGFKRENREAMWVGPFVAHQSRPKPNTQNEHPVWQSIRLFQSMGLVTFVPHLYENDSSQAEIIHPYGVGSSGEEPIERQIGEAADAAGRAMASWNTNNAERMGFEYLCPVPRTLPNVQMVGIARLRYRPHTLRTSAWYAQLQQTGNEWLRKYHDLTARAERSLSA